MRRAGILADQVVDGVILEVGVRHDDAFGGRRARRRRRRGAAAGRTGHGGRRRRRPRRRFFGQARRIDALLAERLVLRLGPPQGRLGRHHALPLGRQLALGAVAVSVHAVAFVSPQRDFEAVVATAGASRGSSRPRAVVTRVGARARSHVRRRDDLDRVSGRPVRTGRARRARTSVRYLYR